ncbi:Chitin bind 4 domain containing protein [Asbolus verrucosus]|uniref:Chitin bind 4 domain containing protein n=1 Tax=Asbolus verrucosus TaxID=1661398 RepID=A0A482VSH1_ASBVE|nr:Chitin bind 4 domain containing protein [Asbolus verrucosus]
MLIMKTILILCGIFGIALTKPQNLLNAAAYILRYDFDNSILGEFSFGVETSDGFKHEQTGKLKNAGTEDEALSVKGSYSYVGPDGRTYTVNYTADENGFQPEGEHIPPSAGVKKLQLSPAAIASLSGGGIG